MWTPPQGRTDTKTEQHGESPSWILYSSGGHNPPAYVAPCLLISDSSNNQYLSMSFICSPRYTCLYSSLYCLKQLDGQRGTPRNMASVQKQMFGRCFPAIRMMTQFPRRECKHLHVRLLKLAETLIWCYMQDDKCSNCTMSFKYSTTKSKEWPNYV